MYLTKETSSYDYFQEILNCLFTLDKSRHYHNKSNHKQQVNDTAQVKCKIAN